MGQKVWTPSETQLRFMKALASSENGLTLREIAKATGEKFATGSVNALVTKGLVDTSETREFTADIVYQGEVIGHKKYSDTVYKLVK